MAEETVIEPAPVPTEPPHPENVRNFVGFHFRMDALKLAQQTLLENARNKPAEEREVTTEAIKAMADELLAFVSAHS